MRASTVGIHTSEEARPSTRSAPARPRARSPADAGRYGRTRSRYGVTVVGVKSRAADFVPGVPDTVVNPGDPLIVSGPAELIEKFFRHHLAGGEGGVATRRSGSSPIEAKTTSAPASRSAGVMPVYPNTVIPAA